MPDKISMLQRFLKKLTAEAGELEGAEGLLGKLEHLGNRGVAAGKAGYESMKKSPVAAATGGALGAGGMAAYNSLNGDSEEDLIRKILAERGY